MRRRANFAGPRRGPQAGFSLVELAVSLAVILVISAVAIPVMVRTLRVYQLNSTANQLASIIKFTRFEAIRRNRQVSCRIVQNGANWQVWADSNDNFLADGPEPQMFVTGSDTLLPAGSAPSPAAIIAALGPGVTGLTLTPRSGANGEIRFDQRGTSVGTNTIYVLYLGNAADQSFGYRAVLVLPSGVVQVWTASLLTGDWKRLS
jgi:prepilin-type N-terminal cleavage/methylation domain-containing protein